MSTLSNLASIDQDSLRGKWILVCRTSGRHRFPSYQRLASTGPWSSEHSPLADEDLWAHDISPQPCQGGYGTHLVFLHPFRNPWAESVATDWILEDCANPAVALSAVEKWISAQRSDPSSKFPGKFDACVSYDDFSISACAYLAEKLGLPTTPKSTIDLIKNKYKLRQICEQIGIPVPRSLVFRLNDLYNGSLESLLNPTQKTIEDNEYSQNFPQKFLPPGQKLNIFTGEWVNGATPQDELSIDLPIGTNDSWSSYYSTKLASFAAEPLQYPLVIKPFSGAGSNFVRKANNYEDLINVMRLFYDQCKDIKIDEVPDNETPEQKLLRQKWLYWGLNDVNSSFMIEECISGQEFDIDVIIQNSEVKMLQINDNYPTIGHKEYFQEAGGLVASSLPFKTQIAMRVMCGMIIKYFTEHVKQNVLSNGTINGVWHFEGMLATNMKWCKKYDYGILEGHSYTPWTNHCHTNGIGSKDDYYVVMPIEINQRMGGSETQCLVGALTGLDYVVEDVKLHCNIPIPSYYSLLPQFEYMNRNGYDRFSDSPIFDPTIVRKSTHSYEIPQTVTKSTILPPFDIPFPTISPLLHPPITDGETIALHAQNPFDNTHDEFKHLLSGSSLCDKLPRPETLTPYQEHLPYTCAIEIAEQYTHLLKVPTPTHYFPPGADITPRWKYASSINLTPFQGGRIDKCYFPPVVFQDRSFLGQILWWKVGYIIAVPPLGFDCLGWLSAGGNTPSEAHDNMLRLSEQLKYCITQE